MRQKEVDLLGALEASFAGIREQQLVRETTIPPALAARPVDPTWRRPVPVVNTMDDGSTDFTVINGDIAYQCAKARECGLCGQKMGRLVAFLGGPSAAEGRTWSDPPMHPDCAEAAVTLCPHISKAGARRVPEGRNPQSVVTEDMDMTKPDRWVMYVTRNYKIGSSEMTHPRARVEM